MLKRIITSFLIPALLTQVFGCYTENLIDKKRLINSPDKKIRIVTNDGKEYRSEPEYWKAQNDTLLLLGHKVKKVEFGQQTISFSSIKEVYVDNLNILETILLTSGIIVVIVILVSVEVSKNQPAINLDGMRWN